MTADSGQRAVSSEKTEKKNLKSEASSERIGAGGQSDQII
jgi:hypothetical protein